MNTKMMTSRFAHIRVGMLITKDADSAIAQQVETLAEQISTIQQLLEKNNTALNDQYKELSQSVSGSTKVDEETRATVKEQAKKYSELTKANQDLTDALTALQKQMEAPVFQGKSAIDANVEMSIELQRRVHLSQGKLPEEFVPNNDLIIDPIAYRSAAMKMMRVGIEKKEQVFRSFNEPERKAFEAASLDSALFSPEMLGFELDCNTLCNGLIDLYDSVSVSRSNFMYPVVKDYGAVGEYTCDARCDADFGPEGNITFNNGKTYDFRGIFCFNKKVLQEANYDLLAFMMKTVTRTYAMNRNRALMVGDGINEPRGWMAANCFPVLLTPGDNINHVDWRRFLSAVPTKYGDVVTVMHPNMFAYLASAVDANGRFIFGDGLMSYNPSDVRDRIRVSDCLPDATNNNQLGGVDNPFPAGSFLAASGNWPTAYTTVNKRPLWMEQWEGGSTAWCVKYVFGAEDGGFTKCCDAVRVLNAGAST